MDAAYLIRGMVMPQYPMSRWAFDQVRGDPYVIRADLGKDFTHESFAEIFVGFARGMDYAAGMWGPDAIHDGLIFELHAERKGGVIPYKARTCAVVPEDGSRPAVDLTFTNLFLAMHAVGVRRGLRYYNDHVPFGTCVGPVDGMALVAVEECRHAFQLHTRLHMEDVADDAYCTTPWPRNHPCETELDGIIARAIVEMGVACHRRGSCGKG